MRLVLGAGWTGYYSWFISDLRGLCWGRAMWTGSVCYGLFALWGLDGRQRFKSTK
ncbi:hypothetical protein SAMN04488071_3603 [Kordiimonas lacus]|jgi:hypothetical protein|uniref:Uncharacterized protein n=1 Tax=Kordiimonas lacus TaxID=637679 RepID=A0A1G7F3I2_9PROT|nr:hypothetical protein SAMN04488071_3603 [Kordiimonas lacus]